MKKIALILFATVIASAFADDVLKISGEAKTGIYWEQYQQESRNPEAETSLHSTDDAGNNQGRIRINLDYESDKGFGLKVRIQWENWVEKYPSNWSYAFGYGNFFDNQFTISVGKLGSSPWGSGGPDLWKDLEEGTFGGMRVEWKPNFIPEKFGTFNVGFVLNFYDSDRDQGWENQEPVSIWNILQETVLGVSYTHEFFHIRFAYRLDGSLDSIQSNKQYGGLGEDSLVYRIEERVLKNYLPGFSISANGHLFALSAQVEEIKWFRNWLYVKYEPELFDAQIRFGYEYIDSRSDLRIKPSFYWNFFGKQLKVGVAFEFCQDFGAKMWEGSPFRYIELQPRVQFNFMSMSSYVAFEYDFKREYIHYYSGLPDGKDPIKQTHYINLRFCIIF